MDLAEVDLTHCVIDISGARDDHSAVTPSPMGHHCIKNSWLQSVLEDDPTLTKLYSSSAYFAIVTLTGVGFGDFHAQNFNEVRTTV